MKVFKHKKWEKTIADKRLAAALGGGMGMPIPALTMDTLAALDSIPRMLSTQEDDDDDASSTVSSHVSAASSSSSRLSTSVTSSRAGSDVGDLTGGEEFQDRMAEVDESFLKEFDGDAVGIIGRALAYAFPEQCGKFVVDDHPDAGIHLYNAELRAMVEKSSVVLHTARTAEDTPYFMIMEVVRLDSGLVLASRLHPICREDITDEPPELDKVSLAFEEKNVGTVRARHLERHFNHERIEAEKAKDKKRWQFWTSIVHNQDTATLRIYSRVRDFAVVRKQAQKELQIISQELRSYERVIRIGTGSTVRIGCGGDFLEFKCAFKSSQSSASAASSSASSVPVVEDTWTVGLVLKNAPDEANNKRQATRWLLAELKKNNLEITEAVVDKIKVKRYPDGNRSLDIKVAGSFAAKRVAQFIDIYNDEGKGSSKPASRSQPKAAFSFTNSQEALRKFSCKPSPLQSFDFMSLVGEVPSETGTVDIFVNNLWEGIRREDIEKPLKAKWKHQIKKVVLLSDKKSNGMFAIVNVSLDVTQEVRAYLTETFSVEMRRHTITIHGKRGPVPKSVIPLVSVKDQVKSLLLEFSLPGVGRLAAEKLSAAGFTLSSKKYHKLDHPDLFNIPSLLEMVSRVDPSINVTYSDGSQDKGKAHHGRGKPSAGFSLEGPPLAVSKALSLLQLTTSPTTFQSSTTGLQGLIYRHLGKKKFQGKDQLTMWAEEIGVKLERFTPKFRNAATTYTIIGEAQRQGEFLRKIATFASEFKANSYFAPLSVAQFALFKPGRSGALILDEWKAQYPGCRFEVLKNPSGVLLHWDKEFGQNAIEAFKAQVEVELARLMVDLNSSEKASTLCYICKAQTLDRLPYCGHAVCVECLHAVAKQTTGGLVCRECHEPVTLHALEQNCSDEKFKEVVGDIALHRARHGLLKSQFKVTCCRNNDCGEVVSLQSGYGKCPACEVEVCQKCGVMDDSNHQGLSCRQYVQRLKELREGGVFTDRLLKGAREFLDQNWSGNLGAVQHIFDNPALSSAGRKSANSWRRFQTELEKLYDRSQLDVLKPLQAGFYAWHGTSEAAIAPICDQGFDPGRRSGQAYGVGEYFGIRADVSHGYARGCQSMLVAFILRAPCVSTHSNFCYVVNTPVDWSSAFNVPVLVFQYAPGLAPPDFVKYIVHPNPDPHPDNFTDEEVDIQDAKQIEGSSVGKAWEWRWEQDNGTFEPYRDELNSLLERHYARMQQGSAGTTFRTEPIRRYVDDTPQCYDIDFAQNLQINVKTKYTRNIARQAAVTTLSGEERWAYQDDTTSRWKYFERHVHDQVMNLFNRYRQGHSSPVVQISYHGFNYELDFAQLHQKNLSSSTVRKIRLLSNNLAGKSSRQSSRRLFSTFAASHSTSAAPSAPAAASSSSSPSSNTSNPTKPKSSSGCTIS